MPGFSVTLHRKRIKNINLRIRRTGEVQISAPVKTPMSVIYNFLNDKQTWIERHRSRLQQLDRQALQYLLTGEYINFLGKCYDLVVHESTTHQRIELTETQLHLFVKPNANQASTQQLLTKWYHTQMQQYLPSLLSKWQIVIGVTVIKVSIKRMKSRWGSCHPIKKHISLNLRLMEKPLPCLEYVIVHELVHLLEASHNHRFYALMSQFMPNWQEQKNLL